MTERHLLESAIGLAGRLSHIPYGVETPEHCGWRSSRAFAQDAPVFRVVGRCHTWIPAERDHAVDSLPPPGTAWEQSRRQRRWLMRNHPEASLGNYLLHDQLEEQRTSVPLQDEVSWHTCFFSLGELTDTTLQRHTGVPMVATVTGSANNILHLARLNQARWEWPQEPNIEVRLSAIAMEKPALWIEEDVGPIHRVKCIVDLKRYDPTRWLAVQRDSGTTILEPEYRDLPEDSSLDRDASHIVANPILRISKEQTGGNVHSDVSFNPSTRSNSPQLAIIDERGYWSVWDLGHTRPKPAGELASKLRICGHIDRGVLENLPRRGRSDMGWHKILWVGRSEDNLELLSSLDVDPDDEGARSQNAVSPLQRSTLVLICNSHQVRLLDLTTGLFLPDLVFQRHDDRDCILDIQISHDPQYFYVLTTSKLFIVRAYSRPGAEWDKPEKVWLILFSTPHFRSSLDRSPRLAITQGLKSDRTISLVFIYSSTSSWIDVFNVEFSRTDPNAVKCRTNIGGLDNLQNTVLNNAVRTLHISPTPIIIKNTRAATKTGRDLAERRIRLYEVTALRPDRSMITVLCAYSRSSLTRINRPSKRIDLPSRARRQRRLALSHFLSSNFVVDDESTTSEGDAPVVAHRHLQAFYKHIINIPKALGDGRSAGSTQNSVLVHNPFDTAHRNAEEALANGFLPVSTLLQLMPSFGDVSGRSLSVLDWENEIGRLSNIHPSVAVRGLGLLHLHSSLTIPASLQEIYHKILEIASSSSPNAGNNNEEEEGRVVAVSERVAYDLYLSLYGIGHYGLGGNRAQTVTDENILWSSQAETLPSSPPRPESPVSTTWPQMSNPGAAEHEDPAMTLLRAYTGTGQFVPQKRLELLDKWKLEAEPSDYTFDIDRSDDVNPGKLRKAKQAAREHRKRRRAETLLQLSQPAELPATQPAPEISFFSSQPRGMSSQRQVIHSDPLRGPFQSSGGPFGRRPNKKVKKQKGGFR